MSLSARAGPLRRFFAAAALALNRSTDGVHVGKVLREPRCESRLYEIFRRNEIRRLARSGIDHDFHSPCPCGVKIDAGNGRKNVKCLLVRDRSERS